jgi:putative tryptophan/tyrosine transport system substrate-binding protein
MPRQFGVALETGREPLRRREFITLIGGAALDWPLIARAQQPTTPTTGFLDSSAGTVAKLAAFYAGLKTEGFAKDHNVAVEYDAVEGNYGRLPGLAVDLVNRKVAVIAAAGLPAAQAAKAATATIPIVFAVAADPVQIGLIGSLDRPGGNITGVTEMAVDREQRLIELLHETIPAAIVFALLVNPTNPNSGSQTHTALTAARQMGLEVNVLSAKAETDFDAVFAALAETQAGGLAIGEDDLFINRSAQLAALALRRGVPAIFQYREFVAAGGLMSYGSNVAEIYHQVGAYSGLILKGGSVADLPVYQSKRVEFIVNLKTAKALGLSFPPALLGQADEVMQ